MRIINGHADAFEQYQALIYAEFVCVAILVDWNAAHVLHDEVRHAVIGFPAIEQPADIRVIEVRENLPLGEDALHEVLVAPPGLQHLDGDLVLELLVITPGKVDIAHAARAEQPNQPVIADTLLELY